jgi:hypothetical protein
MPACRRTLRHYAQHARLAGNVVRMTGGKSSSVRDEVFGEDNLAAAHRSKLSGK